MTVFRVAMLVIAALSALGVMADDKGKKYLLCLFTLSGLLFLLSFAVSAP